MKKSLWLLATVSALLIAPICLGTAQSMVQAGEAAVSLVDKETDSCWRKIITKRIFRLISATDEQKQTIDNLWQASGDATRAARQQLRSGILDLSHLLASDEATDEQITERAEQLLALNKSIMDERLKELLPVRHTLTKEQRQKIDKRINEFIISGLPRTLASDRDTILALRLSSHPLEDSDR